MCHQNNKNASRTPQSQNTLFGVSAFDVLFALGRAGPRFSDSSSSSPVSMEQKESLNISTDQERPRKSFPPQDIALPRRATGSCLRGGSAPSSAAPLTHSMGGPQEKLPKMPLLEESGPLHVVWPSIGGCGVIWRLLCWRDARSRFEETVEVAEILELLSVPFVSGKSYPGR